MQISFGLRRWCLLLSIWAVPCWSASLFPDQHDGEIKTAVKRYLPGVDWRLLKAQLWQESRFDARAVSPVGAGGISQFMPDTWEYVSARMGIQGDRFDTRLAIRAAAYYMAQQRRFWSSPRPETDRHKLALCNYNAGAGNCLAAQRLCAGALLYDDIIVCLPRVTGQHARETTHYVRVIYQFYAQMRLYD